MVDFSFQRLLYRRGLGVLLLLALVAAPIAQAVVKNISIVNAAGQPVANQTVTITFPDGTKKEDKTDDKGMLIFDFPDNGDYKIDYPGGTMTVNVAGGIPWVAVGVGLGIVAAGVVVADDDDDTSGNPNGGGGPLNGSCTLADVIVSNPDSHPNYVPGATCQFSSTTGTATANCTNGANLNASLSGSLNTGTPPFPFNLTGSGSYAGFTGTGFTMSGTFDPNTNQASGNFQAGTNGNLPDTNMNGTGDPISVDWNCTVAPP